MTTLITAYTLSECMDAMATYVTAYEQAGDTNIIFCEDRLTLIAERTIIRALGGTFATSVTTFSRYLNGHDKALSKQGSVMAVGNVMAKLQREKKLQCFTSVSGIGVYAKSIYETLSQFFASGITSDVLKEANQLLTDDVLRKKTADLALILEGYEEYLRQRDLFDESRYLQLLPEKIRAEDNLKNCNVFFLGYTSFTKQSSETIRAVCERAKNVIGIFCGGKEDIYTNASASTFEKVCKEYGKVRVLPFGEPLTGEAEVLRKSLYNPEFAGKNTVSTERIKLFEANDKSGEAEYVAVQIRRCMQTQENARYRDFAVLVPAVTEYTLPMKRAFEEYDIPYFIDVKRSLKAHPLAEFILDAFRVVKERFSPVSVQALTANLFFGNADEYRNYLLKFAGYRGGARREIKRNEAVEKLFPNIEYLEECRKKLLLATQDIQSNATGREYCLAVRGILKNFHAEDGVKALEEQISDTAHKGYLAQIYRALEMLLSEAELLVGDKTLSVGEFTAILEDGLDATEISLIPLKSDAVFIGDIAQSRIEKVSVLFALGMTDVVPQSTGDTAIVSDKEIEKLKDVKALLEPTVAEVNLRTRESVCLNLCTFMDELHFTYPLSADGSEPSLSEIFRYVDDVFVNGNGEKLPRRKEFFDEELPYLCSAPAPAIRRLLLAKSRYERKYGRDTNEYSTLYGALDKLSITEKDDYLMEDAGQVRIQRAEELFFKNGALSPTALETYFGCPFQMFASRGLKLKEREESAMQALDTGNFMHELLEACGKQSQTVQSEEEMRAFIEDTARELAKKPVYTMNADTEQGAVFSEKLIKEGVDVAMAMFRQIHGSAFRVESIEQEIRTKDIFGKVDRVDSAENYVRIIDYKTGYIDDSPGAYYTGRKIQMQLYMSALKGERIPAGVFYFPAVMQYEKEDTERFRMHGFLNGDEKSLLLGDPLLTQRKVSPFFSAGLNTSSTHVMDEATFRDFLDYSVYVARQATSEIKDGYVKATPYQQQCEHCRFGGMCGYQKDNDKPRSEVSVTAKQIAKIAKDIRESGEE